MLIGGLAHKLLKIKGEIQNHLRFKYVKARMKKMLNMKENAKRATMHIQYQDSVVYKPLSFRRAFPTVVPLKG